MVADVRATQTTCANVLVGEMSRKNSTPQLRAGHIYTCLCSPDSASMRTVLVHTIFWRCNEGLFGLVAETRGTFISHHQEETTYSNRNNTTRKIHTRLLLLQKSESVCVARLLDLKHRSCSFLVVFQGHRTAWFDSSATSSIVSLHIFHPRQYNIRREKRRGLLLVHFSPAQRQQK